MSEHGETNTTKAVARRPRTWLLIPAIVLILLGSIFVPWNTWGLNAHPEPAQTYADAIQRLEVMRADQESTLSATCVTKLMTHGQSAERVIVLVHGYTSCPQQFDQLGRSIFDLGYNVLIAPLPHHGLPDRLNTEQSLLTAEELSTYADGVLDIADGLGEHVNIAGISGGGVVTAWAAQNRSDVDLAVVISPAFGFKQIPTLATGPVMNLFQILPNSFTWWDPVQQDEGGIPYAYPRYASRALTQFMRLGFSVREHAQQDPPGAKSIIVVTNGNEPSVNNELTMQIVKIWRGHSTSISTYEFPADLGLPHDLIDPLQPDQQTETVYPKLIELITQPRSAALP